MLKQKRQILIDYIKKHSTYLAHNAESLDIYEGNLRPYVDSILKSTLSETYYNAVKHRSLPINILQRYVDKVSNTYSKPPERVSENKIAKDFVDFYADYFDINNSGIVADQYSNLSKCFAWEPYIDLNGRPSIRELSANKFLVYSDSKESPDQETIFLKFIGQQDENPDSLLIFAYSNTEFDAFYLNGATANEFLIENGGVNLVGIIPFVYGKRQKNKLIPTVDTDMLSVAKTIPVMLIDAVGAQMFQAFSVLYGIDITATGLKLSPNAFWDLKSDKTSDKTPQVGVLSPQADTDKVMSFIINVFVLWLETKGIRVGSIGSTDAGGMASGISKIIDEMDTFEIRKKSMKYFEEDEEELWNDKLPKIHNYWIKSGMISPSEFPPIIPEGMDLDIDVNFEEPAPLIDRATEIKNIKDEVELGTMTLDQAIRKLHPDYTDDKVEETKSNRVLI
jgi:hypothetical protein